MTLACSGTRRDLPNLDSRINKTPWSQSMSARSSLIASPILNPLATRSPINVWNVAALSGEAIEQWTWSSSASMSPME